MGIPKDRILGEKYTFKVKREAMRRKKRIRRMKTSLRTAQLPEAMTLIVMSLCRDLSLGVKSNLINVNLTTTWRAKP